MKTVHRGKREKEDLTFNIDSCGVFSHVMSKSYMKNKQRVTLSVA